MCIFFFQINCSERGERMDVGEISCWRRSKLNLPPPLVQFARLFNRHFSEGKFILERIELFLKKYPHSPKLIEQFFFQIQYLIIFLPILGVNDQRFCSLKVMSLYIGLRFGYITIGLVVPIW